MPKSSVAKKNFRPGSLNRPRTPHMVLLQMARDEEQIAARAERLKALRKAKDRKLTQRAAGDAIGVTERAYHEWEAGRSGMSFEHIEATAAFYEVSPSYIEHGMDRPQTLQTPDLSTQPSQLDRIEQKLDQILELLTGGPLTGEEDEDALALSALFARLITEAAERQKAAPDESESAPAA